MQLMLKMMQQLLVGLTESVIVVALVWLLLHVMRLLSKMMQLRLGLTASMIVVALVWLWLLLLLLHVCAKSSTTT